MMNEMNEMNNNFVELNDTELENVTGGKTHTYITGDNGKSYVHTGPGLDYKRIGVLHIDETARFLGDTSTDDRGVVWYKIKWDGREAWVSSRYTAKIRF